MRVTLNGDPADLEAGTTVATLVTVVLARSPKGLAVAVNEEVVPRSTWDATELRADDRIELLSAAQGGC